MCLSLLFDETCQHWDSEDNLQTSQYHVPSLSDLKRNVAAFKESLTVTDDQIREIDREQRLSPKWHSVRRFRITASNFGRIFHRKETTRPPASTKAFSYTVWN